MADKPAVPPVDGAAPAKAAVQSAAPDVTANAAEAAKALPKQNEAFRMMGRYPIMILDLERLD
jgi:hypothetical protein